MVFLRCLLVELISPCLVFLKVFFTVFFGQKHLHLYPHTFFDPILPGLSRTRRDATSEGAL